MPDSDKHITCEGTITWIYYDGNDDTVPLRTLFIRSPREILLEFGWKLSGYSLALTSTDGIEFFADFTTEKLEKHSGSMRATLYKNAKGYILFGKWLEDGYEMWVVSRFRENV